MSRPSSPTDATVLRAAFDLVAIINRSPKIIEIHAVPSHLCLPWMHVQLHRVMLSPFMGKSNSLLTYDDQSPELEIMSMIRASYASANRGLEALGEWKDSPGESAAAPQKEWRKALVPFLKDWQYELLTKVAVLEIRNVQDFKMRKTLHVDRLRDLIIWIIKHLGKKLIFAVSTLSSLTQIRMKLQLGQAHLNHLVSQSATFWIRCTQIRIERQDMQAWYRICIFHEMIAAGSFSCSVLSTLLHTGRTDLLGTVLLLYQAFADVHNMENLQNLFATQPTADNRLKNALPLNSNTLLPVLRDEAVRLLGFPDASYEEERNYQVNVTSDQEPWSRIFRQMQEHQSANEEPAGWKKFCRSLPKLFTERVELVQKTLSGEIQEVKDEVEASGDSAAAPASPLSRPLSPRIAEPFQQQAESKGPPSVLTSTKNRQRNKLTKEQKLLNQRVNQMFQRIRKLLEILSKGELDPRDTLECREKVRSLRNEFSSLPVPDRPATAENFKSLEMTITNFETIVAPPSELRGALSSHGSQAGSEDDAGVSNYSRLHGVQSSSDLRTAQSFGPLRQSQSVSPHRQHWPEDEESGLESGGDSDDSQSYHRGSFASRSSSPRPRYQQSRLRRDSDPQEESSNTTRSKPFDRQFVQVDDVNRNLQVSRSSPFTDTPPVSYVPRGRPNFGERRQLTDNLVLRPSTPQHFYPLGYASQNQLNAMSDQVLAWSRALSEEHERRLGLFPPFYPAAPQGSGVPWLPSSTPHSGHSFTRPQHNLASKSLTSRRREIYRRASSVARSD